MSRVFIEQARHDPKPKTLMPTTLKKPRKASGDLVLFIVAALAVVSIIIFVASNSKLIEFFHGACEARLLTIVSDIQKTMALMTNEPDAKKIPVTLESCMEGIFFSSRKDLSGLPQIENSLGFTCPAGYKAYIIGFYQKKDKDGKEAKTFSEVTDALDRSDYTTLIKNIAAAKIDILKLKPVCKNLIGKEHEIEESKTNNRITRQAETERYCIMIKRNKGGIFSILPEQVDEAGYKKCDLEKPELPSL